MLASIIASHVRHARIHMRRRSSEDEGTARIALAQSPRNRPPTPRATQIQAVEMSDLSVGAITHGGRREERERVA
jgi:hypothetical protein